mgnify:CR=1 FL=1
MQKAILRGFVIARILLWCAPAWCGDDEAAERSVTTSTYGLGRDFNEELMVEMAKRGGGNHYYGDTAEDRAWLESMRPAETAGLSNAGGTAPRSVQRAPSRGGGQKSFSPSRSAACRIQLVSVPSSSSSCSWTGK